MGLVLLDKWLQLVVRSLYETDFGDTNEKQGLQEKNILRSPGGCFF